MKDKELDGLLEEYFEKRDFFKINDILIKYFKIYFTNLIKEKKEDYKYTTLNDMQDYSKKYLDIINKQRFLQFYEIQKEDNEEAKAFELKELFDIVKTLE